MPATMIPRKCLIDSAIVTINKTVDAGIIVARAVPVVNENGCPWLRTSDGVEHKYTAEAGDGEIKTPETVVASANDIPPYLGTGFYGEVRRNNKPSFQAKWLKKTQFAEPNDETETKGETMAFQTPTVEGTVFKADDGSWKEQAEFKTEAEARAWLNKKANITEG